MKQYIILGIHVTDRTHHAVEVQDLLTEYGCYIKTRLGLHEVDDASCSPNGLLLLEMFGDTAKIEEFEAKLRQLQGVEIKKMLFSV